MARMNHYAAEPLRPVTMPPIRVADIDIEAEAREAVACIAERRVIRAGLDAWEELGKAGSFTAWVKIGAALAIGREYALRADRREHAIGSALRQGVLHVV
jgi:hypothetical protein